MSLQEFLDPQDYVVERVSKGVTDMKMPGILGTERHPSGLFLVRPKDDHDEDRRIGRANVFVGPHRTNDYRIGSQVMIAVLGGKGSGELTFESHTHMPPLSIEVENGELTDDRTRKVIQILAAHAIATQATLEEI